MIDRSFPDFVNTFERDLILMCHSYPEIDLLWSRGSGFSYVVCLKSRSGISPLLVRDVLNFVESNKRYSLNHSDIVVFDNSVSFVLSFNLA